MATMEGNQIVLLTEGFQRLGDSIEQLNAEIPVLLETFRRACRTMQSEFFRQSWRLTILTEYQEFLPLPKTVATLSWGWVLFYLRLRKRGTAHRRAYRAIIVTRRFRRGHA